MKTLAIYALEVLACSGVLLAAYTILLDRRVKFRWCRLYLLASTAAAALIPLLRIPVWPGQVIVATPTVTAPDLADWTAEVLPDAEAHAITPGHLCLGLYLAGATLILGIMLWQIFRIRLAEAAYASGSLGRRLRCCFALMCLLCYFPWRRLLSSGNFPSGNPLRSIIWHSLPCSLKLPESASEYLHF